MATRKGDIAKQLVKDTIIKAFGDSFVCVQDKKIYLNIKEGIDTVQIAITMTMPKTPVAGGAQAVVNTNGLEVSDEVVEKPIQTSVEISPEDKAQISRLKEMLGIAKK